MLIGTPNDFDTIRPLTMNRLDLNATRLFASDKFWQDI